jgi:hypothetical protein
MVWPLESEMEGVVGGGNISKYQATKASEAA